MPELPAVALLQGLHNPREGQASQAVHAMGVVPSSFWAKGSSPLLSPLLRNKTRTAWKSPRHLPAKQGAPQLYVAHGK